MKLTRYNNKPQVWGKMRRIRTRGCLGRRQFLGITNASLIGWLLLTSLSCDSSCPAGCHINVQEPYRLYVASNSFVSEDHSLLVVDPIDFTVVDSMFVCNARLSAGVSSIAAVRDGSVFVSCGKAVYAVDFVNRSAAKIHDERADIFATYDDRLLILTRGLGEYRRVGFIDAATSTVSIVDSLSLLTDINFEQSYAVDPFRPLLYGFTSSRSLIVYNFDDLAITQTFTSVPVSNLAISPDGATLFTMNGVVDLTTGALNRAYQEDPIGWVQIDRSGTKLFFTDLPRVIPLTFGSGVVRVYDAQLLTKIAEIDIDALFPGSQWLSQMQVAPNDSLLFITPQLQRVIVIDLQELAVRGVIELNNQAGFIPIHVGPVANGLG